MADTEPTTMKPLLRWGIIGTGWISSKFATDILTPRPDAPASHVVAAIGSSSIKKATSFVDEIWPETETVCPRPSVYSDYQAVYACPDVDIVYIGTPHALHKKNCLEAIAAGKHVLCEKPFTINEAEAREVVDAARKKGVFVMEAVWTRFFPLVRHLQKVIHNENTIGSVSRMFCDFSLDLKLSTLPETSRLKDLSLGAGALLDLGIYCLTYGSIVLGKGLGDQAPTPQVTSDLILVDGVDYADALILRYSDPQRTAILTTSVTTKSPSEFCRIEGSRGVITLFGPGASVPSGMKIQFHSTKEGEAPQQIQQEEEKIIPFKMPKGTMGFIYEADAVAADISQGRTENLDVMPLDETLRMMRLMDGIRKAGGVKYPQDG